MTDCPRRDAWLRGCRFEPRYDEGSANGEVEGSMSKECLTEVLEKMRTRIYVRDVCVTCGRTVEREGK